MRALIVVGLLCGLISAAGAETPKKKKTAPAPQPRALVLVIDRSGSMQGPRLEAAKESARVAVEALRPTDIIAVVTFDSEAAVFIPPTVAKNKKDISEKLSHLVSGGGTNILPGLKEAADLLDKIKASKKHVMVLSDGEAPYDGIEDLVKAMRTAKITTTAIGIPGADRNLLSQIADAGEGRLYMVEDLGALPKIFLKEVREALR